MQVVTCTGAHVRTLRIVLPDKILRLMTCLIIIILLSKTMCVSLISYATIFLLLFCLLFHILYTGNAFFFFFFFLQILVFCQCAFDVFDNMIALA